MLLEVGVAHIVTNGTKRLCRKKIRQETSFCVLLVSRYENFGWAASASQYLIANTIYTGPMHPPPPVCTT